MNSKPSLMKNQEYSGNEQDLIMALDKIRELKMRYGNVYVRNKGTIFNQELVNVIELEGMLDVAEAICLGAKARKKAAVLIFVWIIRKGMMPIG